MIESYPIGEECRYNGRPHPLVERLPYYHLVSKNREENARQRIGIRRKCCELTPDGKRYSPKARARQKKVWEACRDDFLLWVGLFAYLVEPRKGQSVKQGINAFCPWLHQEPVMASIDYYWGRRHIVGDKSRAQGASWMMVAKLVHSFIFFPDSHLGIGSKDEETADDPADPMSLGWKIDFIIKMLPVWMRPSSYRCKIDKWKDRKKKTWRNPDNGSFIKAFSATSGIARGGRYTAFFLDESAFFPMGDEEAVANLLATTDCLVMISTPNGMDNEHYERIKNPGPWLRIVLDWKDNPSQNAGLYTVKNGRLEFLDKSFDWGVYPNGYNYILDGRVRSPWYDRKWQENNGNALYMDQEYGREYQGSKGRPFPQAALNRMKANCRKEIHRGTLDFDYQYPEDDSEYKWHEGEAYKFDLWLPIQNGYLPEDRYFIGVDLSRGVGGELSSNSVLSIWNERREQVGELADNTIDPVEFAHLVVAVAYWLGRGMPTTTINWEIDGPGQEFGLTLKRLQYPKLWVRPVTEDDRRLQKKGQNFGYSNKNRDRAIRPLKIAIINESITIRSEALLEECGQYIIGDDGKPMHPKMKTARDGSSKGISHGDRVIAAAMAIHALDDLLRGETRKKRRDSMEVPREIPVGSMAHRMQMSDARERERSTRFCRW